MRVSKAIEVRRFKEEEMLVLEGSAKVTMPRQLGIGAQHGGFLSQQCLLRTAIGRFHSLHGDLLDRDLGSSTVSVEGHGRVVKKLGRNRQAPLSEGKHP